MNHIELIERAARREQAARAVDAARISPATVEALRRHQHAIETAAIEAVDGAQLARLREQLVAIAEPRT